MPRTCSELRCTEPRRRCWVLAVLAALAASLVASCSAAARQQNPVLYPWHIDYAHPSRYLISGNQSTLTARNAAYVDAHLHITSHRPVDAGQIVLWMHHTLHMRPNGGLDIGRTTINSLLRTRTLTGCHDTALVFATVLRHFGIPALMVDTADIAWARAYRGRPDEMMNGHVLVEAYLDRHWTIVEPGSGQYAIDYDHSDPVVPSFDIDLPAGNYVLYKGIDPAGYGVEGLDYRIKDFADRVHDLHLAAPHYRLEWPIFPAP